MTWGYEKVLRQVTKEKFTNEKDKLAFIKVKISLKDTLKRKKNTSVG